MLQTFGDTLSRAGMCELLWYYNWVWSAVKWNKSCQSHLPGNLVMATFVFSFGTPHKSQKEIQFLVSFACANLTKWLCVIGQWSVTCFVLRTDRVAIKNCVLQLLVVPKSCFFKACTHIYAVTTWLKWDRALRVSKSAALILILHLPDSLCYRNFLEPYHVNG